MKTNIFKSDGKEEREKSVASYYEGGLRRFFLGMALLLMTACSNEVQHTDNPLLASKGGGTSGGPIQGTLTIRIFDESTRFPIPGAIVALGGAEGKGLVTSFEGLAVFDDVFGPQDIHVFACAGCTGQDAATQAFPYQMVSFYQINAAHVAIPLIGREPLSNNRVVVGKVFGAEKDETVHVTAIDARGQSQFLTPTRSITYQVIQSDPAASTSSPSMVDLRFLFSKDLDDWAATDPAGGKQGFN